MHSYGFPKNIKVRLQLIALTVMFLALRTRHKLAKTNKNPHCFQLNICCSSWTPWASLGTARCIQNENGKSTLPSPSLKYSPWFHTPIGGPSSLRYLPILSHFIINKKVVIQTANILSTFTWNFIDLFVMIMSTAMAVRFKQISERIKTSKVRF